jgi:NADH-quinone oxidoreductase subunit N
MNIGAFVVVSHFGGEGERYVEIDDYAGLGYRFPVLAACFSVFLLSLIGIPLTAGFFGKFYIFRAALRGDLVGLTVLAALNSGIAAYYYLRVLVAMYMTSPTRKVPCEPLRPAMWLALMICVAGTLFLGIFPQSVLNFVSRAAQGLQTVP